jgi:hypothetical protein
MPKYWGGGLLIWAKKVEEGGGGVKRPKKIARRGFTPTPYPPCWGVIQNNRIEHLFVFRYSSWPQ